MLILATLSTSVIGYGLKIFLEKIFLASTKGQGGYGGRSGSGTVPAISRLAIRGHKGLSSSIERGKLYWFGIYCMGFSVVVWILAEDDLEF